MGNKIEKVSIVPGCISCGSCEAICSDVFEVKDIAYVKTGADLYYQELAEDIEEAADMCPVSVIKLKHEQE